MEGTRGQWPYRLASYGDKLIISWEVLHYTRHEITEQFIFFQPQLLRKLDLRTMYQHNSYYFQHLDRVANLPIADVSQPATSCTTEYSPQQTYLP